MVSTNRWHKAQKHERDYWQKKAARIAYGSTEQLNWYAWKAVEMEKRLQGHLNEEHKQSAKILEIGSGPIGIVTFLKWGERYTIDPLEDFYKSNPVLSHQRDSSIHYCQGTGEKLPFEKKYFSLVILDNVLDHVNEAESVLKEIFRVLSDDGVLYLAVNVHTKLGGVLHSVLSKLKIDKGHPYTFTAKSIRNFIREHQFLVQAETVNDYYLAREKDRKSTSLKEKIKGYTGLSEFIYYSVCKKRSSTV
ncbi:MAG: class I SAM-dependent methyltransferase [Deltaproteobacteria bacterium]|nr:class I SAM-dependent methyltransferase [Deltaproteobacteria bacterium]